MYAVRTTLVLLSLTMPAIAGTGSEGNKHANTEAVRDAISKALPYLAKDGRSWMDGKVEMQDNKKCVSCHYVAFAAWSHDAASRAGLDFDVTEHKKLNLDAIDFISDPKIGRLVTYSHMLLANTKPKPDVAEKLKVLAARIPTLQEKAGFWKAKGQFPTQKRKIAESNAVATMWALAATRRYAKDPVIGLGRARGLQWLKKSKPGVSTEWDAWRLVTSHTESLDDLQQRRDALLARQNADGGWGWLKNQPSDAYTTGQVLYALQKTGLTMDKEAVARGTAWLLKAQKPDGTWTVSSELTSAEPDENKDQIYSYWGTAWSVIALANLHPAAEPIAKSSR